MKKQLPNWKTSTNVNLQSNAITTIFEVSTLEGKSKFNHVVAILFQYIQYHLIRKIAKEHSISRIDVRNLNK